MTNFFFNERNVSFQITFLKNEKKFGKSWGTFFFDIEILQNVCNYFVFQTKTKRNEVFLRGEKKTKCSIIKKRNVDIPNPDYILGTGIWKLVRITDAEHRSSLD